MELCPLCKTALKITRTFTTLEGTTLEDAKIYTNMEQACPSDRCQNFNKVVDVVRVEQVTDNR